MPDAVADQKPWDQYASQKPWELYGTPAPESIDQEDQVLSPPPTPGVPGNVPPNPLSFSELFSGIRTPQDISKEIGGQVGKGLQREGAAIPAALADIGTLPVNTGENKFRNLEAVMSDQPVPYEQEMRRMPTAARIAESGIAGTLSTAPQMAAFAANPALGVAAFGTTPEGFDPKQAALAAVLPIVGKYTGAITEAIASKAGIASDLALKVFNKIGGAAGAAGLLGADQVNTILQLPKDQQKDAWIDAIGNIGSMAFLGTLGERHQLGGESNAIQKQSPGSVFQRQPEEAGAAGGERGRVEPGQQGQETAGAGQGAQPPQAQVPLRLTPDEAAAPGREGVRAVAEKFNLSMEEAAKLKQAEKDRHFGPAKTIMGPEEIRQRFGEQAAPRPINEAMDYSPEDLQKYQDMKAKSVPKSADEFSSPEFQQNWKDLETLRNKYNGMPPKQLIKSPTTAELAPAPEGAVVRPVNNKNAQYTKRNGEWWYRPNPLSSEVKVTDTDVINAVEKEHRNPTTEQSPTTETGVETTKNEPGKELAPAQSSDAEVVPEHGVVKDEETGLYHVVNGKDEIVETHDSPVSAQKAANVYNGFKGPNLPIPEVEPKVKQTLDDPEQQKHLDAERGHGIPIELTDDKNTTHPFAHNAMAWADRSTGKIMLNKDSLNHFLSQMPASRRGAAIRSVIAEERIHMHTTDAEADAYWKNLSPWEQQILKRRYSRGLDTKQYGMEMTDTHWGLEALRYRIQQLARMKPTEVAFAVGKEKWTLKALSVAEHVIRNARALGSLTKGIESRAILKRIQQNIDLAKQSVREGSKPAALRGRGRPKVVPTPKEQQDFILPGMETKRVASEGSGISALGNVPGKEGAEVPSVSEEARTAGDKAVESRIGPRPTANDMTQLAESSLKKLVEQKLETAKAGSNTRLPNLKEFTREIKRKWSGIKPGHALDLWSGAVGKFIDTASGEDLRLLGKSAFGGNVREILSDKDLNERFKGNPKAAVEYAKRQERALIRESGKGSSIWNAPVVDAGYGTEEFNKHALTDAEDKYPGVGIDALDLHWADNRAAAEFERRTKLFNEGKLETAPNLEKIKASELHDLAEGKRTASRQYQLERTLAKAREKRQIQSAKRRRAWIASAIFRKMVKPEVADSEGILNRKSVTPDDVRTSNDGKYSSYQDLADFPQSKIADALADKGRRSSSDSATVTRRLAVLENKRTGEVHLVSAYDHPHGPDVERDVRVIDPLSPTRTHVPLEDILQRYRALRSVFLDQPVRKFRQDFKDLDEFNDKFGDQVQKDVDNAAGYSPDTLSPSEFAQEAGGRISEGSGGSFQGPHRDLVSEPSQGAAEVSERTPLTDPEIRAVSSLMEAGGSPRNAADVKRVLQEMVKVKPSAQAISALRKLAAGVAKAHPDWDADAQLNALAHDIYEKSIQSARALKEGGQPKAADSGEDAGAAAQTVNQPTGDQKNPSQRGPATTKDVISSERAKTHDFKTGEPVTVQAYHGSRNAGFTKFSRDKDSWFSSDPDYASGRALETEIYPNQEGKYIEGTARSPAVYPVEVTMKNPLVTNVRYPHSEIEEGGHDGAIIGRPGEPKSYLPYPEKGAEIKSSTGHMPMAFFRRSLETKRDDTLTKLGVVKNQVANAFKRQNTAKHMAATMDGMDTIANNMGQQSEWSVRLESSNVENQRFGIKPNFRGQKDILEATPAVLAAKGIKVIYHYDNRALAEKARLLREDPVFVGMVHSMKNLMTSEVHSTADIKTAQENLGLAIQSRLRKDKFLHATDAKYLRDPGARANIDFLMTQLKAGSEQARRMKDRGNVWDRFRGRRWIKSNDKLMRTLEYAKAQWDNPQLVNTARRVRMEMDRQYDVERNNGYSINHDPNYLPGRYDGETWSPAGILFGGTRVLGKQFRAAQVFDNIYHAASVGPYIPASLDVASLVGSRVRQGMHSVARRMWWDSLKELHDDEGKPVAREADPAGNSPSKEYYKFEMPGGKSIYILEGYRDLVHQLVDPSGVQKSTPLRLALEGSQFLKHTVLLGDFFHLGRVQYYSASILGKNARYKPGWAATAIREADLDRAVDAGVISARSRDYLKEKVAFRIGDKADMISRSRLSELYERAGLNTGQIQDALYKDLARQMPGFGRYNRFLFDRFTTGMMKTAALGEFDRLSKLDPQKDSRQIIQESAKALNFYFGSIGRQGWIKSSTWRDVARLTFLAPQWLEGLIKKEVQPLKLLTSPRRALTGRDTAFRGIANGMLSMLALTQVVNLITRGTPTWNNQEKDHKWDAYLGNGVWLSPMAVFNELTSDILRIGETKQRKWDTIQQVGMNKLGFWGRVASVLWTGNSPTGEYQSTTMGVIGKAASQLIPTPISLGLPGQIIGHMLAPGLIPPTTMQQATQRAFSIAGFKTHAGLDPVQATSIAAQEFKKAHGIAEPRIQFTDEATASKIRYQLSQGDERGAARTLQQLLKTHDAGEVIDSMNKWARRPFTSEENEGLFVGGMDDEGRRVYNQAIQQRYDSVNQFIQFYVKESNAQAVP